MIARQIQIDLDRILTAKQREAFVLLCQPTDATGLYGGGRSGKTFDICTFLTLLCLMYPCRHLALRKHLSTLVSSVWLDTMPKVIDTLEIPSRLYTFKQNRYYIKFYTGAEFWFYGLDSSGRADKVLGNEYSMVWINEASEFDPDIIPHLQSRLAQNVGVYNKLILDFNPPETSHYTYDLIMNRKLVTTQGESSININHLLMNPSDNVENLPASYIKLLDTFPGRQRNRFRDGIFSTPEEAIFKESMIKWAVLPVYLKKIVIGVDPAITNKPNSDETGIILLGKSHDTNYKIEDRSMRASPDEWGFAVVFAYLDYESKAQYIVIVAEVNQGGDMVKSVVMKAAANVCRNCRAKRYYDEANQPAIKGGRTDCEHEWGVKVNYQAVHTGVSKEYRAEDFSMKLSQLQWFFNSNADFGKYIKQFLGYTSLLANKKSPDRIDAAIIADSELNKQGNRLYSTVVS